MSSLLDSFVSSLGSTRSRRDSGEMANCYNLYVHHNEMIDIDDDFTDPPAFQIPAYMKWRDILGLVIGEIGCDENTEFCYLDDENDEVRINSQEEYETALHICRKERRDLHIYSVQQASFGRMRRKEKSSRHSATKEKKEDFTLLPDPCEQAPFESKETAQNDITKKDESKSRSREPTVEGAVGGEPIQMDEITSSLSLEDKQETKPLPPSNSLLCLIRKEAREAIADEVNDIWAFINALKRDLNTELDVIGEHLASRDAQPTEKQTQTLRNEEPPHSISDLSSSESDEEIEEAFAASFICESHPDDSVVSCGEKFKKHWVFKNEGNTKWGDDTKLHLLDESCDPSAATGSSLSEWGATSKSIPVPPLKEGETGVVCAEHVAPAHPCHYQSSWKLSHKNNPFGPRVWCRVQSEQKSVPAVEESPESFVELEDTKSDSEEINEDTSDRKQYLVPASKVEVVESRRSEEEQDNHDDLHMMSFSMGDISNGAKYIDATDQEVPHFNPAVSSVEHEIREKDRVIVREAGVGASVDVEVADESISSDSPVMVSPASEVMADLDEEPRTLENNVEEVADVQDVKEDDEEVENFTEQTIQPHSFSSDEESEEEGEVEETTEPLPGSNSEDLQSVDYAVEEEPASLASFASGFVVVPLPDCFDVNKPLNGSQCEEIVENHEKRTDADFNVEDQTSDEEPNYPPGESESDPESQPPSVTLATGYKSEESLAATTPKTVNSPQISLAATEILPREDAPPSGGVTPQPESADNESLTEQIHKEFDAFLANPAHPVDPIPPPKIPINQMAVSSPKITLYATDPKPVPDSVKHMDAPYKIPNESPIPSFPPFEQGWRRNPIPLPPSVTNNDPWHQDRPTPAPRSPLQLPRPEPTLNSVPAEFVSALPSVPFAIASPSASITEEQRPMRLRRPPSPEIAIAGDFYPVAGAMGGSTVDPDPEYEDFQTPPPSPPAVPIREMELGPLDQLYEMGFHEIELNKNIWESCGRDLSRTVQALVLRAEADQRYHETA